MRKITFFLIKVVFAPGKARLLLQVYCSAEQPRCFPPRKGPFVTTGVLLCGTVVVLSAPKRSVCYYGCTALRNSCSAFRPEKDRLLPPVYCCAEQSLCYQAQKSRSVIKRTGHYLLMTFIQGG